MTPGESPHVLCGWVAWGIHVARASLPWWGGGSREIQTEEGDQNNPLEKADIPFLGKEGGDIPPNSLQLEFPRLSKPHVFGPVDSWPQL